VWRPRTYKSGDFNASGKRIADETINGALDRGVIVPALGLQEPLCD
jgi:hypothetical protein